MLTSQAASAVEIVKNDESCTCKPVTATVTGPAPGSVTEVPGYGTATISTIYVTVTNTESSYVTETGVSTPVIGSSTETISVPGQSGTESITESIIESTTESTTGPISATTEASTTETVTTESRITGSSITGSSTETHHSVTASASHTSSYPTPYPTTPSAAGVVMVKDGVVVAAAMLAGLVHFI